MPAIDDPIPAALLELVRRASEAGLRALSDQELQALEQAGLTRFKYPRGKQWTQKGMRAVRQLETDIET